MASFDEVEFRRRVQGALEASKIVLNNARAPHYLADAPHKWEDSFLLVRSLTNVLISGYLKSLETVGLTEKQLAIMKDWSRTQNVTMRLKVEETCALVRETQREVESATKAVTTHTVLGTTQSYTVTKVTEFFWLLQKSFQIITYAGTSVDQAILLCQHSNSTEIKTTIKSSPRPERSIPSPRDVNLTWLLQHIDERFNASFDIDRQKPSCHTPRRNPDVDAVGPFMFKMGMWYNWVFSYMQDHKFITPEDMVVSCEGPPTIVRDLQKDPKDLCFMIVLLAEEAQKLSRLLNEATRIGRTAPVQRLAIAVTHARALGFHWLEAVKHVEDSVEWALIAAIGRTVGPVDIDAFMQFHDQHVYAPEFCPRPFSYAVRRPGHTPEGVVSVLAVPLSGELGEPIRTFACSLASDKPITFALNAAATVTVHAERYVHGWLRQQFSKGGAFQHSINARARQFSSFILLAGRITGPDQFEPSCGLLVQNRDELNIPLGTFVVPSAKQFREAVSSLSSEQQRFAKAIRSMQLESTLFGLCIIQVKPQLERLLNLPPESLTKELFLTQDLLDLFVKYQIPCDLLSYNGDSDAPMRAKVNAVRGHAAAMMEMIRDSERKEHEAAELAQQLRLAEMPPPPPPEPAPASPKPLPRMLPLPLIPDVKPTKEGYLLQKGKIVRSWRKRYFKLDASTLWHLKTPTAEPKDVIELRNAQIRPTKDKRNFTFSITADGETWDLQAATEKEMNDWINALRTATSWDLIGKPMNLTHNIHVDFSSSGGFSGMPTEWQALLQSSGITREEVLHNAAPLMEVLSFMDRHADKPPQVSPRKAPPPDPPVAAPAPKDGNKNMSLPVVKKISAKTAASPSNSAASAQVQEARVSAEKPEAEVPPPPASLTQDVASVDWTKIPHELEKEMDRFEGGNSLRQTIINIEKTWHRNRKVALLADMESEELDVKAQEEERTKVFDLLDALTRSGSLPVLNASMHVLIAATHSFDMSVMETIIQRNVNPIESLERSSQLVASTIFRRPSAELCLAPAAALLQ